MRAKRVLSLLLATTMSLSLLAGCGAKKEEAGAQDAKKDGPVELTVGFWNVQKALSGGENDKLLKTLEEKTNVKLIPQDVSDTDYHEKVQLWATNGQLPDIFCGDFIGLGQSSFYDWVDQGVIRALPDDLSEYPNLKEYMTMQRAIDAQQKGKNYIIPRRSYKDITYSVLDRNIIYRWDLAQQVGVTKEPETWDEFRDMLRKIIAADPEGKNIGGMCQQGVKTLAGCMYPYGGILEKKWVVNEEGKVLPSMFDGDFESVMQLARDMYQEGTILKDVTQINGNTAYDAFIQGKVAALAFNGGPAHLHRFEKDYQEIYGRPFLGDFKVAKIFPAVDGEKWYFVDTMAWSETYISGKVDDEKMEAILRLYDFLLSEEGKTLMFCGIEGEDYDMVDGRPVMKEGVALTEKYPFALMNNLAMGSPSDWDQKYAHNIPDEYYALNEARHEDAVKNGKLPELCDAALMLSTPLKDKFYYNPHDDFYRIMMGTEPVDKMVEDTMKDYKTKGLDAMLEEVNKVAKEKGIIK